jgi:hypothetical protein
MAKQYPNQIKDKLFAYKIQNNALNTQAFLLSDVDLLRHLVYIDGSRRQE